MTIPVEGGPSPENIAAEPPTPELRRTIGYYAIVDNRIVTDPNVITADTPNARPYTPEPEARWRTEADPARRVESFLEDNAGLFADSAEAWQAVSQNHQEYEALNAQQEQTQSRRQRRDLKQKLKGLNRNKMLAIPKANGLRQLLHFRKYCLTPDTPYVVQRAGLKQYYAETVMPSTEKQLVQANAEAMGLMEMEMIMARGAEPYSLAYLAYDEAVARTTEFLQDNETAKAFLNRLEDMAGDPSSLDEYPGVVELLATHVVHAGESNNILQAAVRRTAPDPQTYSKEYLEDQVGSNGSRGKEINAIVGVIQLLGSIVKDKYGIEPQEIRNFMADRPTEWPVDLKNGLESYARARTQQSWEQLRNNLAPYVRLGRLPAANGIDRPVTMIGAKSGVAHKSTLQLGTRAQDHESVVAPKEITSFAIVGPKTSSKETYGAESVTTLDELYEASNLAEYARHHSSDTTLEPMLKLALEHLTSKPFDRLCAAKLRNVEYEVAGDPRAGKRNPWRFKPQNFAGVAKGDIATATRIIYDVVNLEGQRTLVIYGAFHKQQIDGMNKLPTRR